MHLSAKPPQRQDLPPRKWPQGGSKTTTSIGWRRKRGNAFTRPILIPRAACPFPSLPDRPDPMRFGARRGIHLAPRATRPTGINRSATSTFSRCPWRGCHTRSHSEHGSQGPHRREYCGSRPREGSAAPGFPSKGPDPSLRIRPLFRSRPPQRTPPPFRVFRGSLPTRPPECGPCGADF